MLGFLCTLAAALAQTESASPPAAPVAGLSLPAFPQASLQIPWAEFKEMLDTVERAQKALETKDPPKPPVPWSISSARYVVEQRDSSVYIQADFSIDVWSGEDWVQVPIVGDTVALESAVLDGNPVSLVSSEADWLSLVLRDEGPHALRLGFYVPVTTVDGKSSFEFPCAASPVGHVSLVLREHDAVVHSEFASNITYEKSADTTTADLILRRSEKVAVNWSRKVAPKAPPSVVEPRVASTGWTLASVRENYVTCKSILHYTMLRGQVDAFSFQLPGDANVLSVTGDGGAWSQAPGAQGAIQVDVKTNRAIDDTYSIDVAYEAPYTGEAIAVPMLQPVGVVRETGYIGISALGNLEVNPSATVEGLTRIDSSEIPEELRAMSPTPILIAFRHGEGSRLLAVDVHKLNDVPVPDSTIDFADLTTLVTDDGIRVTRVIYEVRNSVRQFLRVRIDENAEVLSARVADNVVKPAQDAASNEVLIPLRKSVEVDRRLEGFPVELVYMERREAIDGFSASLELTAPTTDILAGQMNWQVFLPESRAVVWQSGEFDSYRSWTSSQSFRGRQATVTANRESIRRLREGVERFFISDINGPAAAPTGEGNRYKGEPLDAQAAGASGDLGRITGVLPVTITLPVAGTPYRYSRSLVAPNVSPRLVLTAVPAWVPETIAVLRSLALFLLGLGFARFSIHAIRGWRSRRSPVRAAYATTFGILIASAVLVDHYGVPVVAGYYGLVLGMVLAAVPILQTYLRTRTNSNTAGLTTKEA